ncbi:hypothetical protein BKA63DRAFT_572350 [Paraphoma chrysanthemicola]|nr:hypothetical protein BKA63DRAFT_572350 [Paraphoma chrysanthemicola]
MPPVNQEARDGQRTNEPKDLETRTNEIENFIAITFGVVALVISFGFMLHFWLRVLQHLLYWVITMGSMHLLYQGMAGVMWLYRKVRGLQNGRLLSLLDDVVGYPKKMAVCILQIWGIQIGHGPLYDLYPEEWKRGREACKNPEELKQYLAQFVNWAEGSAEDDDGDNLHDDGPGFVNPYDVEYEANPVIFSHLQDHNMQPQLENSLPAQDSSNRLGKVIKP